MKRITTELTGDVHFFPNYKRIRRVRSKKYSITKQYLMILPKDTNGYEKGANFRPLFSRIQSCGGACLAREALAGC